MTPTLWQTWLFQFSIVNFRYLYLCNNIPSSSAYDVYILQLIRYARTCSTYDQFLIRGSLLTNKLVSQGFLQFRLQAAFRKFYDRYNDLIIAIVKPFLTQWSWLRFYRLPDLDFWLMVDVTGRRGMLPPSKHLFSPLVYPEIRVPPIL
jgi:hypothetical protein